MPLIDFPPGDNATDTVIEGVHFSLKFLRDWNYQYYSNGTVSNDSWCYITAPPFTPTRILANGTFLNSTWCYTAQRPVGPRGATALGLTVLFGLAIVLNISNLHRHGSLFLPSTKRFYPVGRRWQWYWSLAACAFACVGLIASVDVERFWVSELPIVLVAFFWYLLTMATMAIIWEAVRHWGSWLERQFIDPDPFVLPESGFRYKFEFFIPLVFYGFFFLNFFVVFPRNWGALELQRSPEQTLRDAVPSATDVRLKIGPFFLFAGLITTLVSLHHSLKHYQDRNRGLVNRVIGLFTMTPLRFRLIIPLALAMLGYQAYVPWSLENSPMNVAPNLVPIYLGGYLPSLLIIYIQIISGYMRPNEDLELIRQRRERGIEDDERLQITRKPAWWRRVHGDAAPLDESMRDRVRRNVNAVTGRRPGQTDPDREAEMRAASGPENPPSGATEASNNAAASSVEMAEMHRGLAGDAPDARSGLPSPGPGATASPSASPGSPAMDPYNGRSDRRRNERTMQAVAGLLFPGSNTTPSAAQRRADLMADGPPPPPYQPQAPEQQPSGVGSSSASINQPPQQTRSMLDV
ncbi:hypothetical protein MAPG_03654 [Magnaporthiopsis poae ATCC 64411]|uniref:Uncharacterized protein n=1 Tax=Magnaporthiopsis poae (strain ATCC 64411 / 73-15) TaxID=644358 RepID=A0A0C4DUL4_MAGP6|nr:hypothetical protein MAPG_03654 [Magnaporthiopsis poae ATCC 64411]